MCTVIIRTPSLPASRIGASPRPSIVRLLAQLVDEPTEGKATLDLVLAREFGHVEHVSQHLLTAMLRGESHVRARRLE